MRKFYHPDHWQSSGRLRLEIVSQAIPANPKVLAKAEISKKQKTNIGGFVFKYWGFFFQMMAQVELSEIRGAQKVFSTGQCAPGQRNSS